MKTGQIHSQDSNNKLTILYNLRFESVKGIATKRPPTMRQTLINPTLKNPKHASVLQENGISYDQPLNPMQVAEIRAQRIQREKKQNQQQQQQQAAASVSFFGFYVPINRRQILDSSKLKEFADDNFKFDENDKVIRMGRKRVGKREIARYEQFLLFPQCFQKAFFPGASKGVIVWEWVNLFC